MTRLTVVGGGVLAGLGLFWAGRESSHGLSAFTEHWWCPLPLVAILLGLILALAARASRPARG